MVFKQGIETRNIENYSGFKANSVSADISIGITEVKPQASMNGIGYGSDSQINTTLISLSMVIF